MNERDYCRVLSDDCKCAFWNFGKVCDYCYVSNCSDLVECNQVKNNNEESLQLIDSLHNKILKSEFKNNVHHDEMIAFLTAREALEKRIISKQLEHKCDEESVFCPDCKRKFNLSGEHFKYCPQCGRALKW